MTEIERIVWADRANLELLNQLRDAVGVNLAGRPIVQVDPPAAVAEGAAMALLDGARLWSQSPRLVSLIVELETLSRSFEPTGRVRGLRTLSPEAVAALLDEAPGGPALARPITWTEGTASDRGHPDRAVALLTARPSEDARLLGRLGADGAPAESVQGVAIDFLPAGDLARLRELFAADGAPGRGDLAVLKADLAEADRAHVALGAARAAGHLRLGFRIADNRRDHRRGSTAASYLDPAPLARLALTVIDMVLPREAPQLFRPGAPGDGGPGEGDAHAADHGRYVFNEILDTARGIAAQTPVLQDLDLFCGISVIRRVSDLVAQERALREENGIGGDVAAGDGDAEDDFDRPTAAARRLFESTMRSRDIVLLLRAYEATLSSYTDRILAGKIPDGSRAACDVIVRDLCGGLMRRYRLARADLADGISHWTDIKPRATGSAQPRRWLPPSVAAAPVTLSSTPWALIVARPARLGVFDDLVADVAAEMEEAVDPPDDPARAGDPRPRESAMGEALIGAWAALTQTYPLDDFFENRNFFEKKASVRS